MTSVAEGKDYIDILVGGVTPQKEFILYGNTDELHQKQDVVNYEATLADIVSRGCRGYTVSDRNGDMSRAENTALRIDIDIHALRPKCLIKQVKCILDGLKGVAFKDDNSIVRLYATYTNDCVDYAQIHITPAQIADMPTMDEDKCFAIDSKIYTLKNVARHEDGTPLNGEAQKKDSKLISAIRSECFEKNPVFVSGSYEVRAIFGVKEINKSLPLAERIAMADYQRHCTYTPDLDNLVFTLLASLHDYDIDARKCMTIDAAKTYYAEDLSPARNIIQFNPIDNERKIS